jgi:hypothetical protein
VSVQVKVGDERKRKIGYCVGNGLSGTAISFVKDVFLRSGTLKSKQTPRFVGFMSNTVDCKAFEIRKHKTIVQDFIYVFTCHPLTVKF